MGVTKLVLDAGPIINLSREEIVSQGEKLYATPAVIKEIRDEHARQKLDLLKNEITVMQPSKEAVTFVEKFADLTGDRIVLSTQDIEVIALAYDLCEDKSVIRQEPKVSSGNYNKVIEPTYNDNTNEEKDDADNEGAEKNDADDDEWTVVAAKPKKAPKKNKSKPLPPPPEFTVPASASNNDDSDSDWSDDGWINPTNLKDMTLSENRSVGKIDDVEIEVAVSTRDYAVQNTTMQMGLTAVNEKGLKIKQLRNFMQRCYACFTLLPLESSGVRQFCPQCGGHTLTRVSTSVDKYGQLHVNLKAKMQWITRGDKYNIPNPQSRRARRERHDTKKEFYAEDQPEYLKAVKKQQYLQRRNERSVADYIGPNTVDSTVSPFVNKREMTSKIQIGRGKFANATGKKTEYNMH